jgi:hypothetical protein
MGWPGQSPAMTTREGKRLVNCFRRSARYLIACGLIGEPVPPVMISGAPQKKNS